MKITADWQKRNRSILKNILYTFIPKKRLVLTDVQNEPFHIKSSAADKNYFALPPLPSVHKGTQF